jgi:hypothetical protein
MLWKAPSRRCRALGSADLGAVPLRAGHVIGGASFSAATVREGREVVEVLRSRAVALSVQARCAGPGMP